MNFDDIEDAGKKFIRFDKDVRDRSINPKLDIGKLKAFSLKYYKNFLKFSYQIDQNHKIIESDPTRIRNEV